MFSNTVDLSRRLKCWKIMPMELLILLSSFSLIFFFSPALTEYRTPFTISIVFPSIETEPLSGISRKLIQLTSVLFPAPEYPITPYRSPSLMLSDTSSRAFTRPSLILNVFDKFFISIIFAPKKNEP